MSICKVQGCNSNKNTKVNGRNIAFFRFPDDEIKRKQWFDNCKLTLTTVNDSQSLHICELHFDKASLTDSNELIPNAVPTIFKKTEEEQGKRNAECTENEDPPKIPLKKQKIDENVHSLVSPPQTPFRKHENIEKAREKDKNKSHEIQEHGLPINGSAMEIDNLQKKTRTGTITYKLIIQIDKIRAKPAPRSKKLIALPEFIEKEKPQTETPEFTNKTSEGDETLEKISKKLPCIKGNCVLSKAMYRSTPAYWCKVCNKYYVLKKIDEKEETSSCGICYKSFPSSQLLQLHIRQHFICDMCQTESTSQITFDKHARLHVSTDPLFPYKCHKCLEIFELKEDVKQHYATVHPTKGLQNTPVKLPSVNILSQYQSDYRCVMCNITFRNEQAYRNHTNFHKKKEGLRCNVNDKKNIPISNTLTGGQIGILQAVKFSCLVCSKQFDNVGEVDKHTRTHLEHAVEEQKRCNMCKKGFQSSELLNEHLKQHLSRAHPCPVCPKAFINRTTLKIHMKTHSES